MSSITIGLDLAKNVFQVHGVDAGGCVVFKKKLRRSELLQFFEALPPCLVGMEACATAPHWGRSLSAFGHQVRVIPPAYVKAYVRRQKNDPADAQAICEAVSRPALCRLNLDLAQLQHHLLRTRRLTSLHVQLLRSWLILSISPVQSQPVTSCLAMNLHPSKAQLPRQFSIPPLSTPRGPLQFKDEPATVVHRSDAGAG